MKEIEDLSDIQLLVDTFYEKVRADDLIGPIFNEVIGDNWPVHLKKMYGFWQSILLNEPTYNGRPFPPHMKLNIEKRHFERWLSLFEATVNDLFQGSRAMEAIKRSKMIAAVFLTKIEYLNEHGG